MSGIEGFSGLVGAIYDAALDASLWFPLLKQLAGYVGGNAAVLVTRDIVEKTGDSNYEYNVDNATKTAYFETYIKLDPTLIGFNLTPIGEAFSTADMVPYEEFLETRFYKEWVLPNRWVDSVGTVLDRSSASSTIMCVFRSETDGLADQAAKDRVRLIAPHLRRSALIGNLLASHANKAANLADALDGLAAAFYLVDARGRLLHTNASGALLLDRGEPLRVTAGRLIAADPETSGQLSEIFAAAREGDLAIGNRGIAVPLADAGNRRFVAHVLPLTLGARRKAGLGNEAAAGVFVTRASIELPSALQILSRTFKLTPTELRVLLALVEVGGAPEVADALGVAETTVKWHLGNIFAKTGTSRQVDLVKLAAGYASPLAE